MEPEIALNYLGQFEQENDKGTRLSLAQESIGPLISPLQEHVYEWMVEAWVQQQRMHLSLSFNTRRYEPEAMRAVLRTYEQQLRRLLAFCLAQTQPSLTPSDLTYKKLSMEQLKNFFA